MVKTEDLFDNGNVIKKKSKPTETSDNNIEKIDINKGEVKNSPPSKNSNPVSNMVNTPPSSPPVAKPISTTKLTPNTKPASSQPIKTQAKTTSKPITTSNIGEEKPKQNPMDLNAILNQTNNNTNISNNKNVNDYINTKIKSDVPVFNCERNNYTKEINYRGSSMFEFDINISQDNLRLIRINSKKTLEELLLDQSILTKMLKSGSFNNEFVFNKLEFIKCEISFINEKIEFINEILKMHSR